jgi:hypothetical protein
VTGRDELIPLASNSLRSKGIQEDVVGDVSVDERCGHEHGRGSAANMQADISMRGLQTTLRAVHVDSVVGELGCGSHRHARRSLNNVLNDPPFTLAARQA